MAEHLIIKGETKEELYATLLPQLKSLVEGESDIIANMANISACIMDTFHFWWVGFYRVIDENLVLGPFQGHLACTRIKRGKGVCGTAWDKAETIVVEYVEKLTDVNLVYLKDVSNEVTNSSALYLQLENDKVKKVQIVDYSSPSLSNSLIKSKILINCYTNGDIVKLDNLNKKNLDEFIGIDSNDMEKIVGDKKVSYDAYLLDNKYINVYKLDEGNKLLAIFVKNNKISQIKVLSNKDEVLSTIKNITLNK